MQGPFKLLFEEKKKNKKQQNNCICKESAEVHHRGSEDHMKKTFNLNFLPPNVKWDNVF